jgi:ABC-type Co2+ transport system permease subunit
MLVHPDRSYIFADERLFLTDKGLRNIMSMTVLLVFLFGVANFTMHRAVVESGHPILRGLGRTAGLTPRRIFFAVEFLVLLAALTLAANGWTAIAWLYAIYSLANGVAAWLILTRRI